jgi:uncharacterized surface protein with fasciclin (FAS1) repeats
LSVIYPKLQIQKKRKLINLVRGEIENIITTHDDLYKKNILIDTKKPASKEVYNYAQGLKLDFEIVRKERLLLNKHILTIQKELLTNATIYFLDIDKNLC